MQKGVRFTSDLTGKNIQKMSHNNYSWNRMGIKVFYL